MSQPAIPMRAMASQKFLSSCIQINTHEYLNIHRLVGRERVEER